MLKIAFANLPPYPQEKLTMFRHLKTILLTLFIVEIILFVLVGKLIGFLLAILLVVLTTLFGLSLFRKQSLKTMQQMQAAMQSGQPPMMDLKDSTLTSLSAILLIIPGFLTDTIGLLLLFPKVRPKLIAFLTKIKILKQKPKNDSNVIEGEYWKNDKN